MYFNKVRVTGTKALPALPTWVRSAKIETENPLMCEWFFLTPAAPPSKMAQREKVEPMFLQKLLEFRTLDAASGWRVRTCVCVLC